MKVQIEPLRWDSEFFEINIWSGSVKDMHLSDFLHLNEFCVKKGIRLVYLFPKDESSVQFLVSKFVPLVDQKVIFRNTNFNTQRSVSHNVHKYMEYDQYGTMCNLALSSGIYSRFKIDNQFKSGDFEKFYIEWIDRSIERKIADDVLVWKDHMGIIKGFVSYKIDKGTLIIGLISVDQDIQGAGIGSSLLNVIKKIALENKVNEINVATQLNNITACNFYKKNNFEVKLIQPIFHLWIQQ